MKNLKEKLQKNSLNQFDQLLIKGGKKRRKKIGKVSGQGIPPVVDIKW